MTDFAAAPLVGRVTRVDPGRAVADLAAADVVAQVTVADLVAIESRVADEWLIGVVESVSDARAAAGGTERTGDDAGATAELTLVGTFFERADGARSVFKRGADHFPQAGGHCRLIAGDQLRSFMSLLGEGVPAGQRLELGHFVAERRAAAIADGDRLFQRHAALLGSTGTGKSWAVAHMLDRAARLPHANIVVFDMHGEYGPLARAVDGGRPIARAFRVAGPGDVYSDDDSVIFLPYWLLDRDELLSLVLDPTDPDAPTQAMRFGDHIHKLKRSALLEDGREQTAATITVDSPVPFGIEHLVKWLRSDDEEKVVKQPSGDVVPGVFAGRLTRFIARLEARIADGRYGFMFAPPREYLDYDWLGRLATTLLRCDEEGAGIKVIDFSEVPAEALPVVTGMIARILYDVQFWMAQERRTPLCLICDEAHLYMPSGEEGDNPTQRQALRAFEEIAKEGRKNGVALLIVSQRPADVSRTVLSQCNNFIVMRLTNDHDQHVVAQLMPESMTGLTDVLPLLDVGEAVVLGDALLLPTRIKFDPPGIQPASATRAFWTDWTSLSSSEDAILAGVEDFRRQVRSGGRPAHPVRRATAPSNGTAPAPWTRPGAPGRSAREQ